MKTLTKPLLLAAGLILVCQGANAGALMRAMESHVQTAGARHGDTSQQRHDDNRYQRQPRQRDGGNGHSRSERHDDRYTDRHSRHDYRQGYRDGRHQQYHNDRWRHTSPSYGYRYQPSRRGYWNDYHNHPQHYAYRHRYYNGYNYYYDRVGFYFPGYGYIQYGHHHDGHCPAWHFEAFATGVVLGAVLSQ